MKELRYYIPVSAEGDERGTGQGRIGTGRVWIGGKGKGNKGRKKAEWKIRSQEEREFRGEMMIAY